MKHTYFWKACKEKDVNFVATIGPDKGKNKTMSGLWCEVGTTETYSNDSIYNIIDELKEKGYENIKILGAIEGTLDNLKKDKVEIWYTPEELKVNVEFAEEEAEAEEEIEQKIKFGELGIPTEHRGLIPPQKD